MANLFTEENLDLWVKKHQNVLLTGKHGVGKTAKVIEAFNRNGLKWMYFSASTMDPWTDFVGVPRVKSDEAGDYLEYILPKLIADGEVEAFFFDEFNRAPKRVRNAVMELIQFKSINGRKLENLKIVWAARNPEDDEETYDVEKLDPAQADRFQVHCDVPFELDMKYLRSKYGDDWAEGAKEWWEALNDQSKDLISPRKLDDALSFHKNGGDIGHIINPKLNISALRTRLSKGTYLKQLMDTLARNVPAEITKFLIIENNWNGVKEYFMKDNKLFYALEFVPKDKLSNLLRSNKNIYNFMLNKYNDIQAFKDVIDACLATNTNDKFTKGLEKDVLARYPKHPIAGNVNRDFMKKIQRHRMINTYGREGYIHDLQYWFVTNKVGLETFLEKDVQTMYDQLASIAKSTHKSRLANNKGYWEVMDKFLAYYNKKQNLNTKTLPDSTKTKSGFNTIYDWSPLKNYGWTI